MPSPSKQTQPVTKQVADAAYVKAYLMAPDWNLIFGQSSLHFLLQVAKRLKSRPALVIGMLMLGVSTLLGPLTTTASDTNHLLKANLYLFLIGMQGTGKSSAYEKLLREPLRKLEVDTGKEILYNSFTQAAIMSCLAANNGHGLVCSDEVCHELVGNFGSKDEVMEFRHNLNNLWSGAGYSKHFKAGPKRRIVFDSSYFCLGGTSQPQPFLLFLQKVAPIQDGILDGLLVLNAHARNNHDFSTPDPEKFYQLSDNWVNIMYYNIYNNHKTTVTYKLSIAAKQFIRDTRSTAEDMRDDHLLQAEKSFLPPEPGELSEPTVAFTPVPEDSKDIDYVIKLSTVLHVLTFYLDLFQSSRGNMGLTASSPPDTIALSTVKSAFHLMSKIRSQMNEMISALTVMMESTASTSSDTVRVDIAQPVDIVELLARYPGKVFSTQMLLRKHRGKRYCPTSTVLTEAISTNDAKPGEYGFFGKWDKEGRRQLFYKAPPSMVDDDFLKEHGVSKEQYDRAYNLEVRETLPVGSLFKNLPEWQGHYDRWLTNIPECLVVEEPAPVGQLVEVPAPVGTTENA